MRSTAPLRLASENEEVATIPSLQQLYAKAFEQNLLPEVNRELLWAAVDPEAYAKWANARLDRAGVPVEYRRFDHDHVVKMVKDMFRQPKSK